MAVPYIFANVLGGTAIPLSQLDANFDYVLTNGSFTGTTSFQNITVSGTATFASTVSISGHVTIEGVTSTGATGTGDFVFATSPTLVTPNLGTPSAVTLTNATGLPVSTGISGLGTGIAAWLASPSSANLATAVTDETGTGSLVFSNGPTITLGNATGLPISTGVSGLGTGIATALAVSVGSAGAPVVNGGALGTPSSGTLTSCTGLPISTGVSGLGSGVGTFLATPSSANLAAAVTGETGSGALVFATSPTLVTPVLGTPTSGTLTNCTGLPVGTGIDGLGSGMAIFLATPSSANLAVTVADGTGTGALVFANTPTLVTPNIGAATGASLAATGLIKSSSATAGIGYATGAGSTVTQGTSRTTGVTINAVSGAITLFSAAGSATATSFTVTNSAVAATDVIILNQKSGTDKYDLLVTAVGAGSFEITFRTTSGTTTEQPVINFAVIKAVAA